MGWCDGENCDLNHKRVRSFQVWYIPRRAKRWFILSIPRAALKAANKLKYNPLVVDGVPQEVPGVRYKFIFQIAK